MAEDADEEKPGELRSLNEELSRVNAQLKAKIEELKRANDDVENFFTSTDLPVLFLDPELKIQRYTPAAEQLLKLESGDLERDLSQLGRELIDEKLIEECRNVLRTFESSRSEKADSSGHVYMRRISPYRTEERRVEGVVIVFQDITEPQLLSERTQSRERQQAVVAQLGMQALSGVDPEELMHRTVRQVAHTLKADFCKVLRYEPERGDCLLVAGIGWQEGAEGHTRVPAAYSQAGYTMLADKPVIVDNLSEERRFGFTEILVEHGVTSGISCVINHRNPPYGVLSVHTKAPRKFTEDDANFLQSVANMLSTAIRAREAQQQLNESEEKFRTMANSIPQLAWMTDEKGWIFWYNQRWLDYTGTTLEAMQGWGWTKVHHPDHVDSVVKKVKHAFDNGLEWEDTFPLRSREGEYRWFLSRAKPIRNEAGKVVRFFGTNTDITEKLHREEELRRNEERLRLAKDSGRLGLFDHDVRQNKIEWEPLLREIWGIEEDEPISLNTFYEGLHPDDLAETKAAIDGALDPGGNGHYDAIYRVINRRNAQVYWVRAHGSVRFKNGKPVRMTGLLHDITEEERTRQQLQQSEQRLRFTLETANIGVWEINLNTMEAERTIEHDRIFGYPEKQTYWTHDQFLSHVHPDDRERVERVFNESLERGQLQLECQIVQVGGAVRWIWASGRVLPADAIKPPRVIGLILDITHRKELEQSLRKAVRELRQIDQQKNDFLSILGHELRNPLAALSGGLGVLEDQLTEDDEVLELMNGSVATMSHLLDDLLDLKRISENRIEIHPKPLQLDALLQRILRGLEPKFQEARHTVGVDLEDGLWVMGDAVRLDQALSNILVNAAKYTPQGGNIEVEARKEGGECPSIIVQISDNGQGFAPEIAEKMCGPVGQVRPVGQACSGLGIGLALSRQLIELHEGSLIAESEGDGKGSRFTVCLPAAESPEALSDADEDEPPSIRKGLKVLVVDDNPSIQKTLPRQLQAMGCEVAIAKDGHSGLQQVKEFEPEAVLLDIGLPDRSGHELAQDLRALGYTNLLVALSGYSHQEIRQKSKEAGFDYHLSKPARRDDLLEVLSQA